MPTSTYVAKLIMRINDKLTLCSPSFETRKRTLELVLDLYKRMAEHKQCCGCLSRCMLNVKIRTEFFVLVALRRAMQELDDYSYDLEELFHDATQPESLLDSYGLDEEGQFVLDQDARKRFWATFQRAITVAHSYLGTDTSPCMTAAPQSQPWEKHESIPYVDKLSMEVRGRGKQLGIAADILQNATDGLAVAATKGYLPTRTDRAIVAATLLYCNDRYKLNLDKYEIASKCRISHDVARHALKDIVAGCRASVAREQAAKQEPEVQA